MNMEEYMKLHTYHRTITIDDLKDKSDRTLLYGYDSDRETYHTYIKNEEIITVRYAYNDKPVIAYVPYGKDHYLQLKRIYPEKSDYEFCKLLVERGHKLPFVPFSEREKYKQYYGKVIED